MEDEKTQENVIKESTTANIESSSIQNGPNMFIRYGKFIVLAVVLLLGVLVLVLLASIKKAPVGKAPPPDPANVLLATVGNKKIYRNDVKAIALEQYAFSALNSKVLKTSLDIAIERAILDDQATIKKIIIEKGNSKLQYYENLKDTIIAREIGTVTANMLSFWVPAFHDIYPQKPEYQQMRDLEPTVFADAIQQLQKGGNTYDIGKSILEKYPVFTPQLGVNSYILSKVTDLSLMQKPVIYQYLVNDSNKLLLDTMFAMNKGQIKILVWPDGEGAAVIQVVDKNNGEKITYDNWLKDKEKKVIYDDKNIKTL